MRNARTTTKRSFPTKKSDMGNEVSSAVNAVGSAATSVGSAVASGAEAVGGVVVSGEEAVGGAVVDGAEMVAETAGDVANAVGAVITPGNSVAQAVGSTVVSAVTDPIGTVEKVVSTTASAAATVAEIVVSGVETVIIEPAAELVGDALGLPSAQPSSSANAGDVTSGALLGTGGVGASSLSFGDRLQRNLQKPEVLVASLVGATTGAIGARSMTSALLLGAVGAAAPPIAYTLIVPD